MQDCCDQGGSSPCFADEIVGGHAVDAETRRDVARFRRAERLRLYGLRRAMSREDRAAQTAEVTRRLDATLGAVSGLTVAVYWPIRGELDLRSWMAGLAAQGATAALPVVVDMRQPLQFLRWSPGCAMVRGVWDIPVPAEGGPVTPDLVIVPLVGVDRDGFRLGNGGGCYDRTLAALPAETRSIGVGANFCLMPTIFPQPWDIAMDTVLLGSSQVT